MHEPSFAEGFPEPDTGIPDPHAEVQLPFTMQPTRNGSPGVRRNGRWMLRPALLAACVLLPRCGGDGNAPTPTGDPVITITAGGLSVVEVRVPVGGRVVFANEDVRPHAMSSDPVQTHLDCPAINDVGTLQPGQRRSTGALTVARTCGFHDHTNEFDNTWKGRIIVQ